MTYRKRRSLDSQVVASLFYKGGQSTWGEILKDIREKDKKVQEKVFWDSLRRLEIQGDIKKENNIYKLASVIRPFQIIQGQYLFNWDEVPGDDDERLKYFLDQYFKIKWIKKANFEKINNETTIRGSAEKKSVLLRLNEKKTNVKIEIDDGRTYELTVKIENGKLNVYIGYDYAETLEIWADSICAQESESERVRTLAEYMYRSLGNINSLTLYVFERYVGFKDPKLAEEYLDWAVKSIDALIKTTAEKLLTPPKEQKFPVPNSTKISNNEINIAGRIITKTLARGLQEDNKECLISWDEIPGNDSGKLIKILKEDFDVDWIEKAIFEKIDDGATIRVSTGKNSLSLKINDEKTRVDLNIDDGRSYQFTVLYEKYIYYQGYPPCDR